LVAWVGMFTYFIQWGAAMVICAILAKEVAKQVKGVHYPLLVAAAYLGNGLWHGGISGTIPLKIASPFSFGKLWTTQGIPFSQTVFAPFNLFIYVVGAIALSFLITAMHPSAEKTITIDPAIIDDDKTVPEVVKPRGTMTPAERMENSKVLNVIIVVAAFCVMIWYFVDMMVVKKQPFSLSIDIVNFIFLFSAMAMYGTPIKMVRAVSKASRSMPVLQA